MRYNVLGKTGLFVSELALGTMTFGHSSGAYAAASGVDQAAADELIRCGIDAGINLIDTANVYAGGQAETIVGRALRNLGIARDDVVIATKAEHATGDGPNDGGASRHHLTREVHASLKRLGVDHIDLLHVHGWDPATPVDETVRALDDLVRRGSVRYVGVSNWAAWQIATALGIARHTNAFPVQSVQAYYSLAGRDLDREIIPLVEAEGLGLIVFSPLAGGYLTGKYRNAGSDGRRATVAFPPVDEDRGRRVLAAMDGVAAARGVPLERIALAWLLRRRAVTSVILGVKRLEQLRQNLAAVDLALTDEDVAALDEASAQELEYPGWMMATADAPRKALLETGRLQRAHG